MVSEDRKREGLALGLSIADNVTLPRLGGLGPWRFVLPSRQRAATCPLGRAASRSSVLRRASGSARSRAATSRRWRSPGCCTPTSTCCCWTSRPAASTSARRRRFTNSSTNLAAGDAGSGPQPKAILMISSYLPELLGTCDEIAVMTRGRLGPGPAVAEWDEHQLMVAATGQEETALPHDRQLPRIPTIAAAQRARPIWQTPWMNTLGRFLALVVVFAFLRDHGRGRQVLHAAQSGEHRAAECRVRDRGARHDDDHHRRRHRSVDWIDHRAHRGDGRLGARLAVSRRRGRRVRPGRQTDRALSDAAPDRRAGGRRARRR